MTLSSTSDPSSMFKDGRLKPGIYKIQNLSSETFLDAHQHSKEVCCRPAEDLVEGGGLWEIRSFGAGYTVQKVEAGKSDQFCTPMDGFNNSTPLYINAYPVAWRIEFINQGRFRGFGFYWGPTRRAWDLRGNYTNNGIKVQCCDYEGCAYQMWRLIPVKVDVGDMPSQSSSETLSSGSPPSYGVDVTG